MINRTRRKKMCHIASFYCLVVLQNGLLHAHMFPAWTSLVTVNSKRYGIRETSHCPRDQGFLSDVTTLAEKRPSRLRLITYTGWGHSTTGPLGDCEPQVASAAKPSMLTLLFCWCVCMTGRGRPQQSTAPSIVENAWNRAVMYDCFVSVNIARPWNPPELSLCVTARGEKKNVNNSTIGHVSTLSGELLQWMSERNRYILPLVISLLRNTWPADYRIGK